MSKRKAIVKKLHSVEALGSVSVICSDKTGITTNVDVPYVSHGSVPGTLTKNEQTVTELYTVDEVVSVDGSAPVAPSTDISPAMSKTLEIGSLCNNAIYRPEEGVYVGHSVDVALLNVLNTFGMTDQRPVSLLHCTIHSQSLILVRRTSPGNPSSPSIPKGSTWQSAARTGPPT